MKPCLLNYTQDEEMEDDAELLLERVEEEMAEDYSEEEDGYDACKEIAKIACK